MTQTQSRESRQAIGGHVPARQQEWENGVELADRCFIDRRRICMMRCKFDIGVVFKRKHTGQHIYPKISVPTRRLCVNASLRRWRQSEPIRL